MRLENLQLCRYERRMIQLKRGLNIQFFLQKIIIRLLGFSKGPSMYSVIKIQGSAGIRVRTADPRVERAVSYPWTIQALTMYLHNLQMAPNKGPYFNYVSTQGYLLGLQNANCSTVRVARYSSKNANKSTQLVKN